MWATGHFLAIVGKVTPGLGKVALRHGQSPKFTAPQYQHIIQ